MMGLHLPPSWGNEGKGGVTVNNAGGANIINIHHAEDVYPFINYPYLDENIPGLPAFCQTIQTVISSAWNHGKEE